MGRRLTGVLLLLAIPVQARSEYVNFRDPTLFAAVDGQASYAVSKAGSSMLLQAEPDGAVMSWTSQGGVGITDIWQDYAPLEIGGREVLTISFASPTTIHSVTLRNLYNLGPYLQTGWYEIDKSGKWVPFQAAEDQQLNTNGELVVNIEADATVISLAAPGWERRQTHDFSVAGLDLDPSHVPEPASLAVFATALGLCGFGRLLLRNRS